MEKGIDEKSQVIDELVELLELQIKLREGGIVFKMAHALGWPGTKLEDVQKKIRNRQLLRKNLEKQDLGTLKEGLEFSKQQLRGVYKDIDSARADYQEKMLNFEQLMQEISESIEKKTRKK